MLRSLAHTIDGLFFTRTRRITTSVTTYYQKPRNYAELIEEFNRATGLRYNTDTVLNLNERLLTPEQMVQLRSLIAVLKTSPEQFETMEGSVGYRVFTNEDVIRVEDRDIMIPLVIKERPPLMVNGKPNYLSYPRYNGMELTASYRHDRIKFASLDGHVLRARDRVGSRTRAEIIATHDRYTRIIEADPVASMARARVEDLELLFAVHPDYLLLNLIKDSGAVLTITVDNHDQTKTDRQTIILAYAFARAAIYTFCLNADAITLAEEDFAALITTLVFAIRPGE